MSVVSKKSEVRTYLDYCISAFQEKGLSAGVLELNKQILSKKVKFPLLEFCAHQLSEHIDANEQVLKNDIIKAAANTIYLKTRNQQ